ncbi:Fumarylacetoacetate (FAA) hydrolase family protein [Micromonospora phaseoli]|uniref:Fumarylacetoacetate (FAA) hydrolase family protein n=1 Tax=Micromonospora phaseoli TaxID=1144548 RepID=A0A1H7DM90_9ACTN|nr:fumarylacetoacetate hydrolase family protein [Micromonospora phaseoli]PZV89445.1 fumarylacetoacetate (FAA) hydrolase family protein [Micromonospora phaseoli]GIJ80268.1 fumarylacetoacetate hydrolase [Micromonospora phaseoli]SEK02869.1 Fumarylacetoacetate (FAA) hydrolase family protein [Micromonospora phaseoli]
MSKEPWFGTVAEALPADADDSVLIGRIWDPSVDGPSPVIVRDGEVIDVSHRFPTVRDICELPDPAVTVAGLDGPRVGGFAEILANTGSTNRDRARPWLLAPVDLQALKAAGVTFPVSMIERVIEERARGDLTLAADIRRRILADIGADLHSLVPGSVEAERLKTLLVAEGIWSQYLEVGIGPDAEIFTKGQILSAVGTAVQVGVLAASTWNNPEPEIALIAQSSGRIVGATLGNDVNLRDVEGRSALLLPLAKDNNASCALGPLIRLFDQRFPLSQLRELEVGLQVHGVDDFHLAATSEMARMSRDPAALVRQLIGPHHQYPDGAVLMLGTMFAPTQDRTRPGEGFTHKVDDVVRISCPALGTLVNRVQHAEQCEPWQFGVRDLMSNLARRRLL